jgi:hypothetical protein
MTRYSVEEYNWSSYHAPSSSEQPPNVVVYVQLLSGEVLSFEHSPHQFLYSLKQKLHEYCPLWKPYITELYQKDSEGEFICCSPLIKGVKEGDHFYLFVKDEDTMFTV